MRTQVVSLWLSRQGDNGKFLREVSSLSMRMRILPCTEKKMEVCLGEGNKLQPSPPTAC